MARLVFPDEGSRLVYDPTSGRPMAATTVSLFTDSAGTVVATDLLNSGGTPFTSGQVTTDAYGLIPLFSGPDGVDTLYARVGTGGVSPVYARAGDRIVAYSVPQARQVAGKPLSADVTLVKGDVGLGSVDNTSDAGKPVSTAQAAALVPQTRTVAGKALSANVTVASADLTDASAVARHRGPWAGPGTVYAVGDIAQVSAAAANGYTPGLWRSLVAHTSGSSFSGTSSGRWVSLAGDLDSVTAAGTYPPRRGGTSSTAAAIPDVNVDDFGAVGDGTTNDASAAAAAITALGARGGKVRFGPKTYRIEGLAVPSNITLEGVKQAGLTGTGTVIVRTTNASIITVTGTTILTSGTHLDHITFRNLRFEGHDYAAPMMDVAAASGVRWDCCFFFGCTGQWIRLREVFDSRFKDCEFEWGGSVDGTLYGIELSSGSGYEFTNQIHFQQCRFESYRGTALGTTGSNTNELFFESCKFESRFSRQTHLVFTSAASLAFSKVQLTGGDTTGGNVSELVKFTGSNTISGVLLLEMSSGATTTLGQYVTLSTSSSVDLSVQVYGGVVPTSGVVVTWDGNAFSSTRLFAVSVIAGLLPVSMNTSLGYRLSSATVAADTSAGTSPPAASITTSATDARGRVGFGTGTATAAGSVVVVTYAKPYAAVPLVTLTAANAATAPLQLYVTNQTTTGFKIACAVAPAASQAAGTYSVTYHVAE